MHILKPRMSEKSFGLSQSQRTFVIDVPRGLNKLEVAQAVESQFDGVEVKSVRIVNRKGKVKRTISVSGKRGTNRPGTQSDIRKAYVTLSKGHLPFFAAEEKEIEEAKAAAEKESKKSAKKSQTKPTDEKKASQVKKETK